MGDILNLSDFQPIGSDTDMDPIFQEAVETYWLAHARDVLAVVYCKTHLGDWCYFLIDIGRIFGLFSRIIFLGIFCNDKRYQGKQTFTPKSWCTAKPIQELFIPLEKYYKTAYIVRQMKNITDQMLADKRLSDIEYKAVCWFIESYQVRKGLDIKMDRIAEAFGIDEEKDLKS